MLGTVTEALPDTLFRVRVPEEAEPILAYLAGKMRMNRIRVLVGDKVELVGNFINATKALEYLHLVRGGDSAVRVLIRNGYILSPYDGNDLVA